MLIFYSLSYCFDYTFLNILRCPKEQKTASKTSGYLKLAPFPAKEQFPKPIYCSPRDRVVAPQSVRELALRAADQITHIPLRQSPLLAPELDLYRHGRRDKSPTKISKPSYGPAEFREQRKLSRKSRRTARTESPPPIRLAFYGPSSVGVLPRRDGSGIDCITLEIAREADAITATRKPV